jgi:peptidoglycan/xylan/chitin deacetylase (PgdA/CDA1 family)
MQSFAGWDDLARELDAWQQAGRVATLWWRDDDAVAVGPALLRLVAVAAGTPFSLAAIGAVAEPSLGDAGTKHPGMTILLHGWRHENYAPAVEKKAELGDHRPLSHVLAELAEGRRRLAALFGGAVLPVLTPPWNRIDDAIVPHLAGIGLAGLSRSQPRAARSPAPGVVEVNIHADLVDWRNGRCFIGAEAALGHIVGHLAARRARRVDASEPTGILTHHLVQDAGTERFLARLVAATRDHPAARWIGAAEAFGLS